MVNYNVNEQDYIDTIEISDIKEIVSNSNSLEDILNILPKTIEYSNDGYVGINNLDYENIEVIPIYNGYYEEFIEETKQYFDLGRNDMDFIPKKIEKDGHILYLINVDWYTQTTKNTGDFEIANLYRGEALYRSVKRIYNPYTYRVIAKYNGIAEKEIDKPYLIKVNYEKIIPEAEKNEDNNSVLPIAGATTSSIFVILLLFYLDNKVKVYCNGKYIGRYKIKGNLLDISNSTNKFNGNNYLLKFNKRLYKKYKGENIKIMKGTLSKYCKILCYNVEIELYVVNMKKKIKDFLLIIIYFIILIISEIMLLRNKDVEGSGLGGIIYFIYLFPLITFIISIIYSLKIRGNGKYFLVLLFGISIMLCDYITYDLAYKRFIIPDISIFIIFGIISLVGILVGNLIKKCINTKNKISNN